MGFSRQGYWSALPIPSPGDLPNPGIEPQSPALQADSLPSELQGKPWTKLNWCIIMRFPGGARGKEPDCQDWLQEMWVQSLDREDPLEEGMATHSSILAWTIPWIEGPSRLQSRGLQSWTWLKWLSTHACTCITDSFCCTAETNTTFKSTILQ